MAQKKKTSKKAKNQQFLELEKMSWKEIDDLPRDKTVFFLPISPLEEHGPHLPVGTDLLTARDTAEHAMKNIMKKDASICCVLLPAIPLGFCAFNKDFPGTITVDSKIVRDVVFSFGEALAEHDFQYLVICTYHMAVSHLKGIYTAMQKLRKKYQMVVYEPWGPCFYSGKIDKQEPKLGFDTSKEVHAGFRETSLMKYQYPYLLQPSYKDLQSIYRDLHSPKVIGKSFKDLGLTDGYVGSPAKADANYGRWFFQFTVDCYVDAVFSMLKREPLLDLPKSVKSNMKLLFWQ
ncbi:MAG: creatininase family protein [Thermoplasmatota archaeon]